MPFTVTGSPTQAFIDALKTRLESDSALMAIVSGIYGHVPDDARTDYPYVTIGYRHADDDQAAGAMGLAGSRVMVTLDAWSNHEGGSQAHAILSRIYVLLERYPLAVVGYRLMAGSLHREFEDVDDEPDEDKPDARLYHGIQRWGCVLDEAA